jgi:hypothetical protein
MPGKRALRGGGLTGSAVVVVKDLALEGQSRWVLVLNKRARRFPRFGGAGQEPGANRRGRGWGSFWGGGFAARLRLHTTRRMNCESWECQEPSSYTASSRLHYSYCPAVRAISPPRSAKAFAAAVIPRVSDKAAHFLAWRRDAASTNTVTMMQASSQIQSAVRNHW